MTELAYGRAWTLFVTCIVYVVYCNILESLASSPIGYDLIRENYLIVTLFSQGGIELIYLARLCFPQLALEVTIFLFIYTPLREPMPRSGIGSFLGQERSNMAIKVGGVPKGEGQYISAKRLPSRAIVALTLRVQQVSNLKKMYNSKHQPSTTKYVMQYRPRQVHEATIPTKYCDLVGWLVWHCSITKPHHLLKSVMDFECIEVYCLFTV